MKVRFVSWSQVGEVGLAHLWSLGSLDLICRDEQVTTCRGQCH